MTNPYLKLFMHINNGNYENRNISKLFHIKIFAERLTMAGNDRNVEKDVNRDYIVNVEKRTRNRYALAG